MTIYVRMLEKADVNLQQEYARKFRKTKLCWAVLLSMFMKILAKLAKYSAAQMEPREEYGVLWKRQQERQCFSQMGLGVTPKKNWNIFAYRACVRFWSYRKSKSWTDNAFSTSVY